MNYIRRSAVETDQPHHPDRQTFVVVLDEEGNMRGDSAMADRHPVFQKLRTHYEQDILALPSITKEGFTALVDQVS